MKLKSMLTSIVLLTALFAPVAASATVYACGNSQAAKQVLSSVGASDSTCGTDPVNHIFTTATTLLSIIVGGISVLVVLWAGFKYITSGGESNKVANAKATLMYALVGLAVAALTQLMIHFVLYQSQNAANPPAPPSAHH